jgi:hypothetical protein
VSPTISIVVATVDGWPETEAAVASFEIAASAVAGEVIIADGSGRVAPPRGALRTVTTWLQRDGESVFQLRAAGYRAAKAPIVAITEDHCKVPPDWARRMLDAHAANPEAVAVGGSVANGATQHAIDWASFLAVQVTQMTPIPNGPSDRLAGAVNVSYRRTVLSAIDDFDGLGAMDTLHQRELLAGGGAMIADDSIRVLHDQSLGWAGTIRIHYHAGRTFTGFVRRRMDMAGRARLAGVLVIPYARFARAIVIGRRKGYGPILWRTWPLILLLYIVQGAGQVIGFAAGPGDSPRKVR